MRYLAHRDDSGEREQTILEHLRGTAALAAEFAEPFGAADEARRCGMLHDIGKYSDAFQRRLNGSPQRVDHSTAGALEAFYNQPPDIPAAFCVAGHHAGLPDGGTRGDRAGAPTLWGRVRRRAGQGIEDYSAFRDEVEIPANGRLPREFVQSRESAFFFIRMLFSCLVDADFLDTEHFMERGAAERGGFPPLEEYRKKLRAYIQPWLEHPKGKLGEKRCEILRAALRAGSENPGIFTFTAPTGSGKTVSSMAFALAHSKARRLRRVIYVIPYCSILEQTQGVFEEIFGQGSVVAHYANVDYGTEEGREGGERDRRYLAAENWDAPVILTTTVQFFESLYANRPSRCRKLHNLAESVLIFDEAQMLPPALLRPCISAIGELTAHYGCSAVLCTATQPALDGVFQETARRWANGAVPGGGLPEERLAGFQKKFAPREICPRRAELYREFRRVRYAPAGTFTDDELAEQLEQEDRVLCIVNRRDQAQTLFAKLRGEGTFHLSTAMCPAHRRDKLLEIRGRLARHETCRVISTSLVEAGVDVDFPVVWRALAGLDSIIQAGGRCNREGVPGKINGVVHIFESDRPAPRMLAQNIAAAKYVLEQYDDLAAPEAVSAYFQELFYVEKGMDALDAPEILKLCAKDTLPFAEVADKFQMINNLQYTVYIPKDGGEMLLAELKRFGPSRNLMRKLGQYAVGVYPDHYAALRGAGAICEIAENAAILEDTDRYSPETGLELTEREGRDLFV